MTRLGTILPTAKSLAINDECARKEAAMKARVAAGDARLRNCDRRVVGGEVRYYDTVDQYAIVGRDGQVKWFAVTPEGDFRI